MSNPAQLDPTADPEEMTRALDELYSKLVPLGRVGRPEEVARLALFLTSEDSSYITGQPFVIDGDGWRGQRDLTASQLLTVQARGATVGGKPI